MLTVDATTYRWGFGPFAAYVIRIEADNTFRCWRIGWKHLAVLAGHAPINDVSLHERPNGGWAMRGTGLDEELHFEPGALEAMISELPDLAAEETPRQALVIAGARELAERLTEADREQVRKFAPELAAALELLTPGATVSDIHVVDLRLRRLVPEISVLQLFAIRSGLSEPVRESITQLMKVYSP
jgi:hypothetical protein